MQTLREQKVKAMMAERMVTLRVVLEDIHDPHNAAAIMRTCDALGIQDVWLVFNQEKAYNPRRVGKSSSSSANKWLSFTTFKSTQECLAALRKDGFDSVATVLLDGDAVLGEYDIAQYQRIALWVGNEHRGLSDEAIAGATIRMTLPMRGMVESLNVSVATALFLHEFAKHLRARGDWAYPRNQQDALAQELLKR